MFQLVHNTPYYNNSYFEKMAKSVNDEIVSAEMKKAKSDIKHINDSNEKLVKVKAEKFILLFEKTFSKHHENTSKEENMENKMITWIVWME